MLKAMSLFCFLWIPLFYLFWRSITGQNAAVGGVWALLLGCITALVQFFLDPLVEPGGFGFSRWLSVCADIVVLPALAPILVYLILVGLKIITGTADFANFSLIWLVPGAAVRALGWSSHQDPLLLVLVPFLWTAIAVGVPFFINLIEDNPPSVIVLASLAILYIPVAAASSYWAFFSQRVILGSVFLFLAAAPMLVSVFMSFFKTGEGNA